MTFLKRSADPFVRNFKVTIDGVLGAGSKITRSHSSMGQVHEHRAMTSNGMILKPRETREGNDGTRPGWFT